MATILGRNSVVEVSTDDITYNKIGKVLSGSISFGTDVADETNNDSQGFKEGKLADRQATLDVNFKYNAESGADVAQGQLVDAFDAQTQLYYRVRPKVAVGEREWKFQGNLTDLTVDTSTGEVVEGSISVESTGTITPATQS